MQVKLDLGQLLNPIAGLLDDPLDLGGDLLHAWIGATQLSGDLLLASDLLAYEEEQAFAQQLNLAGEVVREGAKRDTSRRRNTAVGHSGNPLAADQLDRGAKYSLPRLVGRNGSQEAAAYLFRLSFVRTNNAR